MKTTLKCLSASERVRLLTQGVLTKLSQKGKLYLVASLFKHFPQQHSNDKREQTSLAQPRASGAHVSQCSHNQLHKSTCKTDLPWILRWYFHLWGNWTLIIQPDLLRKGKQGQHSVSHTCCFQKGHIYFTMSQLFLNPTKIFCQPFITMYERNHGAS